MPHGFSVTAVPTRCVEVLQNADKGVVFVVCVGVTKRLLDGTNVINKTVVVDRADIKRRVAHDRGWGLRLRCWLSNAYGTTQKTNRE